MVLPLDFFAAQYIESCRLLGEAGEIIYVSEEHSTCCMNKRNRYMVDSSAYCICACLHPFSGTEQTVKYVRQKGLGIISVSV